MMGIAHGLRVYYAVFCRIAMKKGVLPGDGYTKLQTQSKIKPSPAGFEPARPEGNSLAGYRINHSTKVTPCC